MKKNFFRIKYMIPQHVIALVEKFYHFLLAFAAAVWFLFPSRRIIVIGVTGTKGKTTVVELLRNMLETEGHRVASASSLHFHVGDKKIPNTLGMTMPGRFFLQRFLAHAVKEKCAYAVVEVTSQGIMQYRHRFIDFDVGVLTNIAPEHIEAHGGFEPYVRAKLDFFWRLPRRAVAVINRSDPQASRVAAATACEKAWYDRDSIAYKKISYPIRNVNRGSYGIVFDVKGHQVKSRLQGDVNMENILAAIAAALVLRISFDAISKGISKVEEIAGRMQIIQDKPFRVVVDYAHTPDSLERVYESLKKKSAIQSNLLCVLGAAGGGRDAWKRPELGKIAAAHCKEIFITNEDPFDESPEQIMEDIASGITQFVYKGAWRIISDRREAIRECIAHAKEGDTMIITGKGSETYIRVANGERIAWSDANVAREELANKEK